MPPTPPRALLLTAGLLASLALAACGSDDAPAAAAAPAAGETDLAAAGCPSTVVIQTDWNPEAEHGGQYQLLGADPSIDAGAKSVSGPLVGSDGESTGVTLEIRTGGPAIGYQTVTSQMYSDDEITLGFVPTDEAIQLSADYPTTGVMAGLDKAPGMIMWDPQTYPDVQDIAGLAAADVPVLYTEGLAYMSYLTGAGILSPDQLNGSYDGSPAAFVAAGGASAQQGFASSEPYSYEHEVPAWGRPVEYQLLYDVGFRSYASNLSVRTGDLAELSPCLEALVPVMQQAQVDYLEDPAATNELILELVEEYDTGWVYSAGVAEHAVATMLELGLAGNGDNGSIGDYDTGRLQTLIDETAPIFTERGTAPETGLTAEDIVTNDFIDPAIGLAS